MSAHELNELRNDVKHFVSERKFEEELGKSVRFHYDRDVVTNVIPSFGERKSFRLKEIFYFPADVGKGDVPFGSNNNL